MPGFVAEPAYRPDIDGLRALAIIPVVLFHANAPGFGGGFIGVDIFFVISGFLITQLIVRELAKGDFSIGRFYERRARRILPALFVVCAASAVASLVLFLPLDQKLFSGSLDATIAFVSNFFFWRQAGYFAPAATVMPLLHTWSLAVEEQFYVLYPLFLVLAWRLARRLVLPLVAAGALASFAFSVWTADHSPAVAFYWSPSRGWELLVGAIVALSPLLVIRHRLVNDGLALIGVCGLATGVFAFDGGVPFPGFAALLPTLSTALLLVTGKQSTGLVTRLLAAGPLVAVGAISYSLYLWHWPLLAFGTYWLERPLTPTETASALGLAVLAAALSWRFVERPFRGTRPLVTRRDLVRMGLAGVVLLGGFGALGYLSGGLPDRFPPQVAAYATALDDWSADQLGCAHVAPGSCQFGPQTAPVSFLLWGDSHAQAWYPVFGALASGSGIHGLAAFRGGCAPALAGDDADCIAFNRATLRLIEAKGIPRVIIAGAWDSDPSIGARLDQVVTLLRGQGVDVTVIGDVPRFDLDVPTYLARHDATSPDVTGPAKIATLAPFSAGGVRIIDPLPRFCPTASTCRLSASGQALYRDDNHLSDAGALWALPLIAPFFDGIRRETAAAAATGAANSATGRWYADSGSGRR